MTPYHLIFIEHDPVMVLLSVLIAVVTWWSVLSMEVVGSVDRTPGQAFRWQAIRSLLLGFGIWAFHFLGMLGWRPGLVLSFDGLLTLTSLMASVLGSFSLLAALHAQAQRSKAIRSFKVIGFALGLGAMHYIGIYATDTAPGPQWHVGWVLLSVFLAWALALLVLRSEAWLQTTTTTALRWRRRAWVSLALGSVLSIMHYVGVAAARFLPGTVCQTQGALSGGVLTVLVTLCVFALLSGLAWLTVREARAERMLQQKTQVLQTRNQLLEQLVYLDAITHLPNSAALELRLADLAAADTPDAALIHIDVGSFLGICDAWGHNTAQGLLKDIKARLEQIMKPGSQLFRCGDQQFALLMAPADPGLDLARHAATLAAATDSPFSLGKAQLSLSCHLGLAHAQSPGEITQLSTMARLASDAAARAGDKWRAFAPHLFSDARQELELQDALRHAVSRGEFRLLYQPRVDSQRGNITGVDASLRWQRGTQHWASPSTFHPIAERYGLIRMIGQWVLEQAIAQLGRWRLQGIELTLSVEVSGQQLEQPGFVDDLTVLLNQHAVPPSRLCIEVSEATVMRQPEKMVAQFYRLRKLGAELALGKFGAGPSSLRYLHTLPITELRIDRSFVQTLQIGSLPVVMALLQMARALGVRCLAEGVETPQQRDCLSACGVQLLEGLLYGRPQPAEHLIRAMNSAAREFGSILALWKNPTAGGTTSDAESAAAIQRSPAHGHS